MLRHFLVMEAILKLFISRNLGGDWLRIGLGISTNNYIDESGHDMEADSVFITRGYVDLFVTEFKAAILLAISYELVDDLP